MVIISVFVLFLIAGYRISFRKTFELRGEISEKEKKIEWMKEKEKEIPFLKAKMEMIETADSGDSSSIRAKLTSYISDYAELNSCIVTEIPVFSNYKNNHLNIQTNRFTVKGSFHALLPLLHELETKYDLSTRVVSAKFYSLKDMQTKRKQLYLNLITQSFKQDEKKGGQES